MSKLTKEQAIEIHTLAHKGTHTQKAIAELFGVGVGTVSAIKTGKNWAAATGHAEQSFQDLPGETWVVIEDYPDYDVSNIGRIRSRKWGRLKLLKQRRKVGSAKGRLYVDFGPRKEYVHRVVAKTFHPLESYLGMECHHIDHDRDNNNETNLEWVTTEEHKALHT